MSESCDGHSKVFCICSLEKLPLDQLQEKYKQLSESVIKEMQNRRDPAFVGMLKYAKSLMSKEAFLAIQIEVYAACNEYAMEQSITVDQIVHSHVIVLDHSASYD